MEVKLNRNGWHRALQRWTFGKHAPQFNSLCPYFWTTIFCLIVSPFVAVYKLIKLVLSSIVSATCFAVNKLQDYIDVLIEVINSKVCLPMYNSKMSDYVEQMTDQDALNIYWHMYDAYDLYGNFVVSDSPRRWSKWFDSEKYEKQFKVYKDKLERWKSKVGDWKTRLKELENAQKIEKAKQAKWEEEQREKKEARRKKLSKIFNSIAYYTKYLVYLLVGTIAVYALYGLSLLGLIIYENRRAIGASFASMFNAIGHAFAVGFPWILLGVAVIATLIFLGSILFKFIKKCNLFHIGAPEKDGFLDKLAKGIVSGFEFFALYFKAAKENYCPHIDWQGDDKN